MSACINTIRNMLAKNVHRIHNLTLSNNSTHIMSQVKHFSKLFGLTVHQCCIFFIRDTCSKSFASSKHIILS